MLKSFNSDQVRQYFQAWPGSKLFAFRLSADYTFKGLSQWKCKKSKGFL